MKKLLSLAVVALIICLASSCQKQTAEEKIVTIETSMGNIVVKLYNETPIHRDNFLKLVNEKFYDSLLFHRVINKFMIQGGDPNSRNPEGTPPVDKGERIPAEFNKKLFHKKGALAAAREGDHVNPKRSSSPSQFYIVEGDIQTDESIEQSKQFIIRTNRAIGNKKTHKFSSAQKEVYKTLGGSPHLDSQYTVFGEVLEGMDVVEKISDVAVNKAAKPLENIYIITMYEGRTKPE